MDADVANESTNDDLLTLPMGVEHAGCNVKGLSVDVARQYAADERLPAEQRSVIADWLPADEAKFVAVPADDLDLEEKGI